MRYYDAISSGYEELHREEQEKKLALIKKHLKVKREDTLLDVGCGTGITSKFDCTVIGLDPAIKLLGRAPLPLRVQGEAEHLPFKDRSFDIVSSVTAIQNFHDIEAGLREILRVGRGKYALTFLKKSAKRERIASLIRRLFRVEEELEEEKDMIFICGRR
jgi:ubiquinone/menaquinone biosynthesis C-methylase UbiE